jgi:hypothetical protein
VPWFRLDESFHSHPKVIAAGNEAIGLYVRCGTYAAEHLTDGFIREDIAALYGAGHTGSRRNPRTGKPETLSETLARTTLWRRMRGGWLMPDYLDYNPSAEQVKQDRKNAAERQRRRRDTIMSRRDSPRDSRVSHTTPTRPVVTPKSPRSGDHDGSHPNCRLCGTNPRGPTPPTPTPPPFEQAHHVNGNPARGDTVHAAAAQARAAIKKRGGT